MELAELRKSIANLDSWNDDGEDKVLRADFEGCVVEYSVRRRSNGKWYSLVKVDGHASYRPLSGFSTMEDGHRAICRRCLSVN